MLVLDRIRVYQPLGAPPANSKESPVSSRHLAEVQSAPMSSVNENRTLSDSGNTCELGLNFTDRCSVWCESTPRDQLPLPTCIGDLRDSQCTNLLTQPTRWAANPAYATNGAAHNHSGHNTLA